MAWIRGPAIGRGASAIVSLATAADSGRLFAVKSADLHHSSSLQKEQLLLSRLNSPFIVQYLGFEITRESTSNLYNLFVEYVAGGTLSDEIDRRGGSLAEPAIRTYARQILRGLEYLHSNGLAHCDIKAENILVSEEGAKITDLGCARRVENGDVSTSAFSGTPAFMAPEVARGEEQGFAADVWALGCTMVEMATGSGPWPRAAEPVSVLYRIAFSPDSPECPVWFSDEAKDFLSKCLERDSKQRWTAKQLLQHPFLDYMKSNSPETDEFTRNSPTSVLDQAFWDSMEVPEARRSTIQFVSSPNSPPERLRRLIGDASESDPNFPNWNSDEDWITVRSKNTEETSSLSQENSGGNPENEASTSGDPSTDYSVRTISESESLSVSIDSVMKCGNVKDLELIEQQLLFQLIVSLITISRFLALQRKLRKVLFLFSLSFSFIPVQKWQCFDDIFRSCFAPN
ncbi:mitogen-activated protein kinase kinase kinase 18-like [Diospyros lotus]|uniref:mitogen-activated protein kinase kinase kinase 18-like n=1 Tax=Diospyros lotus TaxID=55363 RepID=UPI00224FCFF6|nr:mitogen-activated protein kinase kinase kinase 18-like [Diospyros lotus]